MKSRLAAVLLLFSTPAEACHRFHHWAYPFPQRCPSAGPESQAVPVPASVEIPLPDLTEITWGETGDARLAAIAMLRALNGGR
jgi:hypothetical protein